MYAGFGKFTAIFHLNLVAAWWTSLSIIMTVAKIPLSQEASKVMYFVCELGLFLVELEK